MLSRIATILTQEFACEVLSQDGDSLKIVSESGSVIEYRKAPKGVDEFIDGEETQRYARVSDVRGAWNEGA